MGVTYTLLLRTLWAPEGLHKITDTLLHDVTPVLYVLWWLCFAPKSGLSWQQPLKWLLYPAASTCSLVMLGRATGKYLYPFTGIPRFGAPAILRNLTLMLGSFWVVGLMYVAISRQVAARR